MADGERLMRPEQQHEFRGTITCDEARAPDGRLLHGAVA
jgi:hypothetical protein